MIEEKRSPQVDPPDEVRVSLARKNSMSRLIMSGHSAPFVVTPGSVEVDDWTDWTDSMLFECPCCDKAGVGADAVVVAKNAWVCCWVGESGRRDWEGMFAGFALLEGRNL